VLRLFALDQNFPQPLVDRATPYFLDLELEPIRDIDMRLSEIDDWELLLALHNHERSFDGLITTDGAMLNQPRALEVVRQTNLTLVVIQAAGHDPIKATGLLFAHIEYVASQTTSDRPHVWSLAAHNRPGRDPLELIDRIANHQNRSTDEVLDEVRFSKAELLRNPLDD